MYRKILLLTVFCVFSGAVSAAETFPEIRKALKKIQHKSEADYKLGDKLIVEMRKLAASRKRALPQTKFVVESQIFRSAKLWYTYYHWRDRQLAANRKYYDKSFFTPSSFQESYKIMQESGFEGVNFFLDSTTQDRFYKAAEMAKISPEKFHIIPTIIPFGFFGIKNAPKWYYKRAAESPYTMRFKGRPLLMGYENDRLTPAQNKKFLDKLEELSGKRFSFVIPVAGPGIHVYPDIYYSTKRRVPASILLRFFDHLRDHLSVAEGIEYGAYVSEHDRTLAYDYYNEILFPLFGAACASPEFNGKKIFAMKLIQGYTNCNGSQSVDADGTKTLRGMLELCEKHKVDMVCGFEWDELNENTNLEPTVSKPMSHLRILRYHVDKVRGIAPRPRKGDDLSIPNLIVSSNRQLHCGQEYALELLNVPDGGKEKYFVTAFLKDNCGKTLYKSKELEFDPAKMYDQTLVIPTENFKYSLSLYPELVIRYKGKKQTFNGLPPTVLRGTASIDYTWFSTPLRNLLRPAGAKVAFKEISPINKGGIRKTAVDVDLKFNEPVNAVEILQNSQVIYAYDKHNEYKFADTDKKLFRVSFRVVDGYLPISYQILLPGAETFSLKDVTKTAKVVPVGTLKKYVEGRSCHDELILVKKDQIPDATLIIRGKRTGGAMKNKPFEWRVKLADVEKIGVCSIVYPDSLTLAVEDSPKPLHLPLELALKEIKFKAALTPELRNGVLALRVVSNSGKVWWTSGYALPATGKFVPVKTVSDRRGFLSFTLPSSRVPDFSFNFNSPLSGNILPAAPGRDFYAHSGGFLSLATGFEGLLHGFTLPIKHGGKGTAPQWINSNGTRALAFDGKTTRGLFLSNAVVPQRSAFTITFDLLPQDASRKQIIWEQVGANSYLNGFQLSISGGKLQVVYRYHTPYKKNTRDAFQTIKSNLKVESGKRQKITLSYDGSKITLAVDGKKESFDSQGIAFWMTISAFGGRGNERFAGNLYDLSVSHSTK